MLLAQFPTLQQRGDAKMKMWKRNKSYEIYHGKSTEFFQLMENTMSCGIIAKLSLSNAADIRGVMTAHRILRDRRIRRGPLCRHLIVCHYLWLPSRMKKYVENVPLSIERLNIQGKRATCYCFAR